MSYKSYLVELCNEAGIPNEGKVSDVQQRLSLGGIEFMTKSQYERSGMEANTSERNELKSFELEERFKDIMQEFASIGELRVKLKNIKDGDMKKQIREQHVYQLTAIRRKIAALKSMIDDYQENDLRIKVLKWERSRKLINVPDEYELNQWEMINECENECECFQKMTPGLRTEILGRYKYKKYYDETKESDVYVTYVPVHIAPEEQITKELAWKISQGFMPKEEDYLPEKIVVRRFALRESEWKRYLRPVA